jgi:hypothetical protein
MDSELRQAGVGGGGSESGFLTEAVKYPRVEYWPGEIPVLGPAEVTGGPLDGLTGSSNRQPR